ncbi:MAG TPA: chemotaxis protein CheB [Rhodocyclaceae bacterium]|nr:chemotaxis protein CheB [Rhodocyclaceae bacterium]
MSPIDSTAPDARRAAEPNAVPCHDTIVVGGSAGALKALTAIAGGLPADLDAALFVVQHLSPAHPSLLPQILSDAGPLPAVHPADGEAVRKGRIYVAPPDHHLLLAPGRIRVVRGPRENRFRPAIDTLFRSAARAYGPRTVGVVLTGILDDGTVGLQAIKQRGGVAVVQDPGEAEYPAMPSSALRYARVDHALPLARIPDLLVRLSRQPAGPPGASGAQPADIETDVAEQDLDSAALLASVETIGTRSTYTCPACNGVLWEVTGSEPLRFRCHVGHAYGAGDFLAEQTRTLENALWSAVRLMEEKVSFSRRMADRRRSLDLPEAAKPYEDYADQLDREVAALRRLILNGSAIRNLAAGVEDG